MEPNGSETGNIYNGKVHVTFDNCQLRTAEIIEGTWSFGWNIWIFNDTVDVTVKNCTIGNFVTTTFSGGLETFGDEQYKSFTMNKKLTVNVQNSSITRFVGGIDKQNTSYTLTKLPTKGIDAILEEGIDLNISGKSNITTLIGGNSFGTIAAVNNGTGDTDKNNNQKGMTPDTHTEIKNHKAAKTGDQTPIWIVITVLIVCAGIIAWIMIRRKK